MRSLTAFVSGVIFMAYHSSRSALPISTYFLSHRQRIRWNYHSHLPISFLVDCLANRLNKLHEGQQCVYPAAYQWTHKAPSWASLPIQHVHQYGSDCPELLRFRSGIHDTSTRQFAASTVSLFPRSTWTSNGQNCASFVHPFVMLRTTLHPLSIYLSLSFRCFWWLPGKKMPRQSENSQLKFMCTYAAKDLTFYTARLHSKEKACPFSLRVRWLWRWQG